MPTIRVNTSQLSSLEADLQGIESRVSSIINQFNTASSNLDWDVKAESNINLKLSGIRKELAEELRGISGMKGYLGGAIEKYDEVANKNSGEKLKDDATGAENVGASVQNDFIATTGAEPTVAGDGDGGSQGSTSPNILKELGGFTLDVLEEFGEYGKIGALPFSVLKILFDGDGFTAKDVGSVIKGAGKTILGATGVFTSKDKTIKELAGLTKFETIVSSNAKAGWLGRLKDAGSSYKKTFLDEINPVEKTASGKLNVKGTKVAGWALSLIANGFSNYEECSKGEISAGRAVTETVLETLIDIGKGAAITAGIAAGCALIGFSAPAVVVGGIGVAVSVVAVAICEKLTGEKLTEFVSDKLIDGAVAVGKKAAEVAADVGKKIGDGVKRAKNAVSGWIGRLTGKSNPKYAGVW